MSYTSLKLSSRVRYGGSSPTLMFLFSKFQPSGRTRLMSVLLPSSVKLNLSYPPGAIYDELNGLTTTGSPINTLCAKLFSAASSIAVLSISIAT